MKLGLLVLLFLVVIFCLPQLAAAPPIRSATVLADGFQIVVQNGTTHTIASTDLPASFCLTSTTLATIESNVATTLCSRVGGVFTTDGSGNMSCQGGAMNIAVHLTGRCPLLGNIIISDKPIPAGWWQ